VARRPELHPLLDAVFRVHILEEARHLRFARAFLHRHLVEADEATLALARRQAAYLSLGLGRRMMLPSEHCLRRFGAPEDLGTELTGSPVFRSEFRRATAKSKRACRQVGLLPPELEALWF
jgi:hypothetical protein